PLAAIAAEGSAGLNWLKRTPPDLSEISESLRSVVAASHRAEETIAGVRGLFKTRQTQRTLIQINDVVREVLDLVQEDLRVETVSVNTQYQPNLSKIEADHRQIQQVILNLIKNAIEAMRSSPPSQRHIRLVTGSDGEKGVSLYVQDSGSGIAPKDLDKIFDPFFSTKPSGMGLGLAICRAIVEDHRGNLRISKTGSRGTSFELTFPC